MAENKKMEYLEGFVEGLSFVIEFVIFTLFIYEEAGQLMAKDLTDSIKERNIHRVMLGRNLVLRRILNSYKSFHADTGILSIYACNSYASFIYGLDMVDEICNIYMYGEGTEYTWQGINLEDFLKAIT